MILHLPGLERLLASANQRADDEKRSCARLRRQCDRLKVSPIPCSTRIAWSNDAVCDSDQECNAVVDHQTSRHVTGNC